MTEFDYVSLRESEMSGSIFIVIRFDFMEFKLKSKYKPTGDQPAAIDELVNSIESGNREQTLLGVTGSGKTFTMANIIERTQRPTLVLAHNKTLAAQLCSEFKEFSPTMR